MKTRVDQDVGVKQFIVVLPEKLYEAHGLGTVGLPQDQLRKLIKIGDSLRNARNRIVVLCEQGRVNDLLEHCMLDGDQLSKQDRLSVWSFLAQPSLLEHKEWMSALRKAEPNSFIFLSPAHASEARLPINDVGVYPINCMMHHSENHVSGRRKVTARIQFLPTTSVDDIQSLTEQMTEEEYFLSIGIRPPSKEKYISAVDVDDADGLTLFDCVVLAIMALLLLSAIWLVYAYMPSK